MDTEMTAAPTGDFATTTVDSTKDPPSDLPAPQVDDMETDNNTSEAAKKDETEAMDVDNAEGNKTEAPSSIKAETEEEVAQPLLPATPAPTEAEQDDDTIEVTEVVLHEWVSKMRKFPKKQFKKWRRHALDELGFVW